MANPFDQFDPKPGGNPFDRFDAPAAATAPAPRSQWENFKAGLGAIWEDPTLALQVGPPKMVTEAVKSAVSGATLPGDVYAGREPMPLPTQMSPETGKRVADMTVFSPINPMVRAGDAAIPAVRTILKPGETRLVADMAPGTASRELPGPGAPVIDMQVTEHTTAPTLVNEPILRRPGKPVPTAEELKQVAGGQYDTLRGMGVQYHPEAVAKVAADTKRALEARGIQEENARGVHATLDKLASPPADSSAVATLENLMSARDSLRGHAKNFGNPKEQLAASEAIRNLDRFIEEAGAGSVVAGPASEAAALSAEARGNWAAAKRSETITGREESAARRAATANSGQNVGNKIRQRVADILDNPKTRAGFSDEELAALDQVARGTIPINALRGIGNFLGGGGGLGAFITSAVSAASAGSKFGFTPGLIAGAVGPLVGAAAKQTSTALTKRALRQADRDVRARSPLYELAPELPAVAPGFLNQLPTRSLLMLGAQQAEPLPLSLDVNPSGYR